jgi:hypothetical protein
MKFKLWDWEYEFDREDAEVVVPLILLLLGLTLTPLNKIWLWVGTVGYYLLYFFLKRLFVGVKKLAVEFQHWRSFRCPYCKSRDIFLQGYEGYHSDEQYAFHLCNDCNETSILVHHSGRLIRANPERRVTT